METERREKLMVVHTVFYLSLTLFLEQTLIWFGEHSSLNLSVSSFV